MRENKRKRGIDGKDENVKEENLRRKERKKNTLPTKLVFSRRNCRVKKNKVKRNEEEKEENMRWVDAKLEKE